MFTKIKKLYLLLEGNRFLYLAAIVAIALATLFIYISPLIIRLTIDSIIGGKAIDAPDWVIWGIEQLGGVSTLAHNLWIVGLAIIALALFQGIFTYFKAKFSNEAAENIARDLRDKLYNHLQRLPFSYHSRAETGDLIQRCTSDVETIRRFLSVQIVEIGRTLLILCFVVPIMWYLNSSLTLIAMSLVPFIFIFAFVFFMKVQSAFQKADEAEGELSTVLQENLTGIRVVRAFGRQEYEIDKFDKKNAKHRDNIYQVICLMATYWAISDLLCLGQIALVLVVGSLWAAQGVITLGTLVVFVTYEGSLLWPIRNMGRILTDLGKTFVAMGRISEILDTPTEVYCLTPEKLSLKGQIKFNNVSFGYSPQKVILNDINLSVNPGQTVVILGPTGAGKTTLVHLLVRLFEYDKGSITIDGKELNSIDKGKLRSQIGIVLQETFLYSKNIKENIAISDTKADLEEVYQAAKIASIHDVILGFEKGYETLVGERGVTLSGGQKQRVAIARAILRECPILVFDDSLSAVDNETTANIEKALKKRSDKLTTFIVTHRLAMAKEADLIVVLENGRITQYGNHQKLMQQQGFYHHVWNIQNNLDYNPNISKAV